MSDNRITQEYHGRSYTLVTYPEPKNVLVETLGLARDAISVFFGVAQDNIGVSPFMREDGMMLEASKHDVAQRCIDTRKAHCEALVREMEEKSLPPERCGHMQFAYAQLVGAYVHMLGVLAEESIAMHKEGKPDEAIPIQKERWNRSWGR